MPMRLMMRMAPLGIVFACVNATPTFAETTLDAVVAGAHRTPAFVERDVYRHPKATLEFCGVSADRTVVEIWPGGGWYTEILAPFLRDKGKYIAAGFVVTDFPDAPDWRRKMATDFASKLAEQPALYDRVEIREVGLPDRWTVAEPATADRVLTFRNVHNWLKADFAPQMFAAFQKALKPGGSLCVIEHRARPGTSIEQMKTSGYVTEAVVIDLARSAGLLLDAKSEINANPRDFAEHPEGVWTLPPTLRLGDKDREKYLAIGESDRMTLRFVKPG
ncbi:MAG: class I SAM-dependent methyltransferase [Panacagrimonas sp.]